MMELGDAHRINRERERELTNQLNEQFRLVDQKDAELQHARDLFDVSQQISVMLREATERNMARMQNENIAYLTDS